MPSDDHEGFAPHPDAPKHLQPRYDPHAFPESGPDMEALKLHRQGAPGGPMPIGTCPVAIKVLSGSRGGQVAYAVSQRCKKVGEPRRGADKLIAAERDAARMDGHRCTNERW